MSATITTTTTTTITTTEPLLKGNCLLLPGRQGHPRQRDICLEPHHPTSEGGSLSDMIDAMGLPSWLKSLMKSLMGAAGHDHLPSESGAAKTINDFQKKHGIGLLSVEQMKKMADTGYCTGKDGKTFQVPPEVQLAAQRMMADNGALFKKMESATNGRHDGLLGQGDYGRAIDNGTISKHPGSGHGCSGPRGLTEADFLNAILNGHLVSTRPSAYGAAKALNDFQKQHGIGLLSVDNLSLMAETGYCKDQDGNLMQIPEEVQAAAIKMMENNGELFQKLESATNGRTDGLLSQGDFGAALRRGRLDRDDGLETVFLPPFGGHDSSNWASLPSQSSAAKTINDFQKNKDLGLLSIDQVRSMAESGYCKLKDGSMIQVPQEVQLAAAKMLENNGELFKRLESVTTGRHDGLLSLGDYNNAIDNGTISARPLRPSPVPEWETLPIWTGGLPSGSAAAKTIHDFQQEKGIGLLSIENVRMMAETGYGKDGQGNTVLVPEEVQAAAKKMLENNTELFNDLESANTGAHDGLLSRTDYHKAIHAGRIHA